MRFRGLVKKINAWARKYIFTFFLVFRVGVRISFQQTGMVPECEKLKQKTNQMNTVENITLPRCSYGFRSGYAFARVNCELRKIHTSEPAESCHIQHEQKIRAKFEAGEGEKI
jgi:uncharacterized protein YoaH (UPF0181 family)